MPHRLFGRHLPRSICEALKNVALIAMVLLSFFFSLHAYAQVIDLGSEGCVEIKDGSRFKVLAGKPKNVVLKRGGLFAVYEKEAAKQETALRVITPDASVRLNVGGCAVEVAKNGTLIKVFGGPVTVNTQGVSEGFKKLVSKTKHRRSLNRLQYEDYMQWNTWVKKWYEQKDDLAADKLEKEYSL